MLHSWWSAEPFWCYNFRCLGRSQNKAILQLHSKANLLVPYSNIEIFCLSIWFQTPYSNWSCCQPDEGDEHSWHHEQLLDASQFFLQLYAACLAHCMVFCRCAARAARSDSWIWRSVHIRCKQNLCKSAGVRGRFMPTWCFCNQKAHRFASQIEAEEDLRSPMLAGMLPLMVGSWFFRDVMIFSGGFHLLSPWGFAI